MTTRYSQAIDLDALIQASTEVDPIPASVVRLASLVSAPTIDLEEVTATISLDQALTGSVLRAANSATSASRVAISTVRDAVHRIGPPTILSIALGATVRNQMMQTVPEYGIAEGELWKHAVTASLAAEVVRATSKVKVPPEVVTAGLLHDIGKLIMAKFLDSQLLEAIEKAVESGLTRTNAEVEVLEVHHGELGALIAQSWGLPETIVQAIEYHHHPDLTTSVVVDAAYLANILTNDIHESNPEIGGDEHTDSIEVMARLGISSDAWPEMTNAIQQRYETVAARYA